MTPREAMLHTIKNRGVTNEKVLYAMSIVNRELFVPEVSKHMAFADLALPIGESQTISQPYIVAKMLDLLKVESSNKVLEIGAGSGYVSALLSKMAAKVIALEINPVLVERARKILSTLKIKNVRLLNQDGSNGFMQGYPYDRILISAATPKITQEMIDQLSPEGIIVAPVGSRMHQVLTRITKLEKGVKEEKFDACMFVPMTGEKGF